MAIGWIRAYSEENKAVKTNVSFFEKHERSIFRSKFKTVLQASRSSTSAKLKTLKWGTQVELPNGLETSNWTAVKSGTKSGFVKTSHLVEVAFIKKRETKKGEFILEAKMDYQKYNSLTKTTHSAKKKLIWGDLVQILSKGARRSEVRVRGITGKMNNSDLTEEALLDVYFIDVGQGDGTLVRTPDLRHMLIDGGLERQKQQTGKNAADLVDWKFFADYGDFKIRLESLMASHSDSDHYGGLHDLFRTSKQADRELDCIGVDVDVFHHPGLSRWKSITNAPVKHAQGLGPLKGGGFIRLLNDRLDAEASTDKSNPEQLSGPWGRFVKSVLDNSRRTKVERVIVAREDIQNMKKLPELWKAKDKCSIKVLAPVSYKVGSLPALKDFKSKSKNTNGHSICLRVEYKKARILLTGDLNTKSMHWLEESFGDRVAVFKCDVAKACHHGSDDISYRFLKHMEPSATVISSGDAEGHAHPRPEVVAASAITGHITIDEKNDKLLTPLVYMTEIERSVTLGSINRIDVRNMVTPSGPVDGVILGTYTDEMNSMGFVSPKRRHEFKGKTDSKVRGRLADKIRREEEPTLLAMQAKTAKGGIRADMNLTVPLGPVDKKNDTLKAWRARMMQKTHYGMVTVRTDGEHIMCATMDETEDDWIKHLFKARFPDPDAPIA